MSDDIPDFVAKQGPGYVKWWARREAYIEKNYTDNPTIDIYLITLETEVQFARENDGVLSEHDVEMWLRTGQVDLDPGHKILKIKKVEQ